MHEGFVGRFPRQVEVQCLLLLEVLGGSHKQAVDGAVKKLNRLWKEVMFILHDRVQSPF